MVTNNQSQFVQQNMLVPLQLMPILSILYTAYDKTENSIRVSFYLSLLNFVHSTIQQFLFDPLNPSFQFLTTINGSLLGIDGISIWLIWQTNQLLPIILQQSYKSVSVMPVKFLYSILLINFWSLMVFLVLDLIYFFISFEAVLLPMFFLIGYFGSRNKKLSALYQFFLYTLQGSLFLFISIVFLYFVGGTTEYPLLLSIEIDRSTQYILWQGFFISFAIKVPMVPFHIWLPLAHTEGNTSASVIQAAILLKLGTYGFLRFSIPQFPEACEFFLPFVTQLAILGIIYSCISALSLIDLKQVIAYSSIAHMNISIIGIFSNNIHGLVGSYCYSISHGLVSGGQFMLVGVQYDRYHTRTLKYYRGLTFIMPVYITLFLIFSLSNLSLPGTFGFASEFLIYYGSALLNPIVTVIITQISFQQPIYFLWTYHKIAYGQFSNHLPVQFDDVTRKEIHLFVPLLFFIVYLGVNPHQIIDSIQVSLYNIL